MQCDIIKKNYGHGDTLKFNKNLFKSRQSLELIIKQFLSEHDSKSTHVSDAFFSLFE